MELELLRRSWENLGEKMQHAAFFNQKLIETIISSRALSTVDKIKRLYNSFYIVLCAEIIFLVAVFVGNPFDFKYQLSFLPFWLLLAGVLTALLNLIGISRSINKLSPDNAIDKYIKGIVAIYDRNKKFEKWFGASLLSVGLLVPFSFLPGKIGRLGLMAALGDTFIMIFVCLTCYFVAFKLGAFKNPYKQKLEKDLLDWNELRRLADKMEKDS
jgi:hypothetical protein